MLAPSPLEATAQPRYVASRRVPLASWPEWLWGFTILCLPFNAFSSGKPQPADFALVLLLCAPVLVTRYKMPHPISRPVVALFSFIGYVALCNAIWAAITLDTEFFKSSLFYAFNAFVFLGYLVMLGHRGDAWLRWTLYGFGATIVLLTICAFVFPERAESGRLELFFNNPNQLGYHVLMSASIVMMLAGRYGVPRPVLYVLLACAFFLEFRTFSRAGVLGIALLAGLTLFQRRNALAILMMPVLALGLYLDLRSNDADLWKQRIQTVEGASTADYLSDRGLDRLATHPEYLFLGAGEGHLIRFHHNKLEIHSSAANLLFSYGIIGTALFAVFLWFVASAARLRVSLLVVPSLTFSLFHHGMRARPFWLLLAVALGLSVTMAIERRAANKKWPIAVSPT